MCAVRVGVTCENRRARITRAAIAAIALAIPALLIAPSPALAADPPTSCGNLALCGYADGGWRTGAGYEINPTRVGCDTPALSSR
jgi:hypothetical protein